MIKNIFKLCGFFFCILSVLIYFPFGITVSAESASFSLICIKDDTIIEGMEWKLYYVGFRQNGKLVPDGDFKDYPISFDDFSAESIRITTAVLESHALNNNFKPKHSNKTDKNGELKFDNLESGLYMACGKMVTIKENVYIPLDILFEVNTQDNNNSDMKAYPKITKRSVEDMELDQSIGTSNQIGDADKFTDVTVTVTTIGTVSSIPDDSLGNFGSQTTDIGKSTTYEVTDVSRVTDFTENSEMTVETSEITVVTDKETEKIPQTGQLWWPVPVMAGVGIFLIAVGLRLDLKDNR